MYEYIFKIVFQTIQETITFVPSVSHKRLLLMLSPKTLVLSRVNSMRHCSSIYRLGTQPRRNYNCALNPYTFVLMLILRIKLSFYSWIVLLWDLRNQLKPMLWLWWLSKLCRVPLISCSAILPSTFSSVVCLIEELKQLVCFEDLR
jgi:hypothetical protein